LARFCFRKFFGKLKEMAYEISSKVVENKPVSGITWKISLIAEKIAEETKPGQFVMVSTNPKGIVSYDPLNRRPFAVADIRREVIDIYYDVVGRGTRKLTKIKEGEEITLLGPLGEGIFPIKEKKAIVVAGGIGASGVSLLVKRLKERNVSTVVLYGARSRDFLSMFEWYENLKGENLEVYYYTDDGSFGKRGFPVQDLEQFIENPQETVIYACGPKPLLRYLKDFSTKRNIETYLSLDRRMACGWGVCLGCVVKTEKGFERVCKEGPVFRADYLVEF
jgi:dihydroorotate dehydrogenase electron transfer subunit